MFGTVAAVPAVVRQRFLQQAAELQLELNALNAAADGDILAATKG